MRTFISGHTFKIQWLERNFRHYMTPLLLAMFSICSMVVSGGT